MSSSSFDDTYGAALAALDSEFGIIARIEPKISGEYTGSKQDPNRALVENITVIPNFSAELKGLAGQRTGSELMGTTKLNVTGSEIWISALQAAQIPYKLKAGDHIRLEGVDGPAYRVSYEIPDSTKDLTYAVSLVAE